jgi:F-type H+-transporting ATPase subunit delta
MATGKKHIQQLSRQLFTLSLVDGAVSTDRVAGVLEYVAAHRPAQASAVLKAYRRLIAAELARGQAVVEHAGSFGDSLLARIAEAMAKRYSRPIAGVARRNDSLLAGLRVRVGDDVYEASVAAQLSSLAQAV